MGDDAREYLINDPVPEWLIVRLESLRGGCVTPKKLKFLGKIAKHLHDAKLYKLNTHVLGFGAYLIRKEGAERMLEYGRRIFMPVDQTTDRYWETA